MCQSIERLGIISFVHSRLALDPTRLRCADLHFVRQCPRGLRGQGLREFGHGREPHRGSGPTDDPTHGGQQLTFFSGHYDTWRHLPVAGFVTFNHEPEQYLFTYVLRPGNARATRGQSATCAGCSSGCATPSRARILVRLADREPKLYVRGSTRLPINHQPPNGHGSRIMRVSRRSQCFCARSS